LPADKPTAESLLHTLNEMHNKMLNASVLCRNKGKDLMDALKSLKSLYPEQHKVGSGNLG